MFSLGFQCTSQFTSPVKDADSETQVDEIFVPRNDGRVVSQVSAGILSPRNEASGRYARPQSASDWLGGEGRVTAAFVSPRQPRPATTSGVRYQNLEPTPAPPPPRLISKLETSKDQERPRLISSNDPQSQPHLDENGQSQARQRNIVPHTDGPSVSVFDYYTHPTETQLEHTGLLSYPNGLPEDLHQACTSPPPPIISYPITSDASFRGHAVGVESSPQKNSSPPPSVTSYPIPTPPLSSENREDQLLPEEAEPLRREVEAQRRMLQEHEHKMREQHGELVELTEQKRSLESKMESTVQHVVKVMSEDKKRLSHRIEVLGQEKAQMHNSNLQLQAMVENMRRHLGSLQAQLHRDNDWSRKALTSFSELSADMSSEISSSNSRREVSIASATRMAEKRASVLAAASKRDELGENISDVAGRFAQLDRANSRMLAQLSKTEDEMKEFRAQNHQGKSREDATTDSTAAMQNRVKFLETQLSALLNERNIYRDRCETMSEKMKKQASDVLDKLSSSNNHDSVRHWSIQTGGIKVLRIDSGATADRRSDRSSDTGEKNKASATEIKAEDVQILDKLAEGTFGVIHRAKWLSALVAVKKLRSYTSSMTPQEVEAMAIDFRREVHQLTHLRHPNILSFYGTFAEAGAIAIVTGWPLKCKCSHDLLSLFIRILTFSEN
jgi:hypothetical protein